MEAEAVCTILDLCGKGVHRWVSSRVLEEELSRNPDEERRGMVGSLIAFADEILSVNPAAVELARELARLGLGTADALHLATAEISGCDLLLTTDDDFLKRARQIANARSLQIRVDNPARWIVGVKTDDS
jgi:predicted nucleic acid-binding protein